MATGAGGTERFYENLDVRVNSLTATGNVTAASVTTTGAITATVGIAAATAGAATLHSYAGKILTDASGAVADGDEYTLTLTNNLIAATDMIFVSVLRASGTASAFAVHDVIPAAGSAVIRITNTSAAAWSSAVFTISFLVVKAAV